VRVPDDRWAKATRYELPKSLFDSAIKDDSALLSAWLTQPPVQPFVISANSDEEALAFVASALDAVGTLGREFGDRAVVLQSGEALKKALESERTSSSAWRVRAPSGTLISETIFIPPAGGVANVVGIYWHKRHVASAACHTMAAASMMSATGSGLDT
jgi:hypothetical protein